MDIKECYRVLELEMGASRDAVETAYCRLLEKWHPDRLTPKRDPAASQEAARMVQGVTEAYKALSKIAPPAEPKAAVPAPAAPPPQMPPPAFTPPVPAPPATSPAPEPISPEPATKTQVTKPAAPAGPQGKAVVIDARLFPAGSPQRRFLPLILVAALLVLFLLAKSVFTTSNHARVARPPDPTKTGRVVVGSNLPSTTVELAGGPAAGEAAPATFHGSGAKSTLPGLPPGKYILTAKADGWPEIREDVNVEVGRATEIAIHFKSGSLRLDSDPTGATVRWGEADLGKTPLVIPALPAGECLLTLEYPRWPVYSFKTTVVEGVETAATARLPHGRLMVESFPSGATIQLGTQVVGRTPLTLEQLPAGTVSVTLRAEGFVPVAFEVTIADRSDGKLHPELGAGFPPLDPVELLRAVWVSDDPNRIAPSFDSVGRYEPRNGIVKNLNRKRLFENWLGKRYRYSAVVTSYNPSDGQIEFAEQKSALSKYRVLAKLSPGAHHENDLAARLTKGATFTFYGRLGAVEEPRWPSKIITLEISSVEPLR